MKAIYKRELKAYLHSFIGTLFIGATLFLVGVYFTAYNLMMGYPYIAYALSSVVTLFLISIPVLTMRILAEERHQKTDQLILTSPVSVSGIVVGKFLAVATVFTIPVVIVALYPLILNLFGTVALGESYLALAGFYFYGLACIAICLFISSLTESQVIAAVLSFGALFLGFIMSGINGMISSTGNLLTTILSAFDMSARFDAVLNGSLEISSFVYYITIIILFLIFTVQSIQKRRYQFSKKTLSLGSYSTGVIIISIAVAVLVNMIVAELPVRYTTFDLTSQKLYSISQQTEQILDNLNEDITIHVLVNEKYADTTLDTTIKQYVGYNSHINVNYVDPAVNPKFYTQYTDAELTSNSVIVESDKRSKVIDYSEIYVSEFDYSSYSMTVTGYDGEGQITGAVAYVTTDNMPKVYALEGHGELSLESSYTSMISKENIDYATINLMDYDVIPEDAACLIINAPTADFSDDDTEKIMSYMENGGDVLMVTAYTDVEMPNFEKLLQFYGVVMTDGLIMETNPGYYYQDPYYLLPEIAYDTITTNVYNSGSYIFAPYAKGLLQEETDGVTATALLSTSEACYEQSSSEDNYLAGPFALGIKCEKTVGEESSVGIIYSCENLFTESADSMVAGNNSKLFAGSIGSFSSDAESTAIPAKSYGAEYIVIPETTITILGIITLVILPFGIIIGGFIIWFKRRKK